MKNGLKRFLFISLGFLLGCLTSVVLLWVGVKGRINYLSQSYGFESEVENGFENIFATPTEDVADPEIYKILEQADKAIQSGNPQEAIDLILPNIDKWSSPIDKATGYQLLAVSEFNLGNPQKAIPYAKKMFENDHGAFSLFLLAQAYDASGDLKNALATYQQILALSQTDNRVDYTVVRERAATLSATLGTPMP
jgi:tetratricopeptide (TPR) repeat protein